MKPQKEQAIKRPFLLSIHSDLRLKYLIYSARNHFEHTTIVQNHNSITTKELIFENGKKEGISFVLTWGQKGTNHLLISAGNLD